MIAGIYTNLSKDKDLSVTKQIFSGLTAHGVQCAVSENLSNKITDVKTFSASADGLDMMIVIGGDGTILDIVQHAAAKNIPVLGINLGKVGFLTEAEPNGFDSLSRAIAEKKYKVEKRAMLCAEVGGQRFYALNEFVVTRRNVSKMIMLRLAVGGEEVDKYYCDGMIVCTPTGSTAYSLSAGGPVISPKAKVFSVTPVNSHSLHSRPIVIGEEETVDFTLLARADDAMVLADGKNVCTLPEKQTISIFKAERQALFVRLSESKFYGRLLGKLNTWSITPSEEV
ncbi:MAG: NAD(+)/NADH kinase [Clostridiales bacterium]|nr:NAD(+)/NADH kinase [Clostridiales bacterium]